MPNTPDALAGPNPWYHIGPIVALAADADESDGEESKTADVYLYEVIGGWFGLSADDFVRDVAGLDVDHIVLHLNTPGGEVSEGVAIANMLRQHRADVRVMVDGMAASSGSVIAMAGDEVVMGLGSQMMIHNPKTWAVGDADEMQKIVRMLESTGDAIASTYAAKAGGDVAEWREVMKSETWYSAEEAVKAGLADRVANDDDKGTATGRKVTPGAKTGFWDMWDSYRSPDRFDLSAFTYQGRGRAPAPKLPARAAEPSTASAQAAQAALAAAADAARRIHAAAVKTTRAAEAGAETDEEEAGQMTNPDPVKIREGLGLAADAPDSEVTAALVTAGLAPAAPPPADPPTDPAPTGSKPMAIAPPGMRLVSDSVWQEKEDRIKKLEAHVARQVRDERDQVIAQAVKDGKFTVAQKDHFSKLWDSDPDGTRNLIVNVLKKDTALATAELGYAGGDDEAEAELAEFDNLLPPHMRASVKAGR
jgi:ATP-dependent protease ClpP protease subunit